MKRKEFKKRLNNAFELACLAGTTDYIFSNGYPLNLIEAIPYYEQIRDEALKIGISNPEHDEMIFYIKNICANFPTTTGR